MITFKSHIQKSLWFIVILFISACASQPAVHVKPLPQYDALFERQKGWTGGDGVYSVALSDRTILWLFGDTWWGDVHNNEHVTATIVNNTVAIQKDSLPQKISLDFFSGRTPGGDATAFIRPADGRGWLWIYHGIVLREALYLFMVQIERTAKPPEAGFKIIGTWLGLVDNPRDSPRNWEISQLQIPWGNFSSAVTLFGSWIMKQDGWVYIYGTTEDVVDGFHHKYMVLARVPENSLTQFNQWRFYANGGWLADFTQAERLCSGLANEYSVSHLRDSGRYVAVYSAGDATDKIVARYAPNPWGPWTDPAVLYQCPEAQRQKNIICYAAKGHPAILTAPDGLIISYIANSTDFDAMVSDAGLYRPRFIKVTFRSDNSK